MVCDTDFLNILELCKLIYLENNPTREVHDAFV